MKRNYLFFFLIGTIVLTAEGKSKLNDQSDYRAIDSIIGTMTVEEKVGQMTQINIDVISKGEVFALRAPHAIDTNKLDFAINKYHVGSVLNVGGHTYSREHWHEITGAIDKMSRSSKSGIPIIYGIDAIHGVNYTIGATLFPQQIGMAATWNPELVRKGAAITAYECRASGIPWNFSPVLDLARQPLWSRFFETYGEDVYLARQMTKAAIEGYQGEDPSSPYRVAACMKHFLGYSFPLSGKDRTPAWIPERQLREYFLPTFEEAVNSGALTVMINSGELNGIPVHANRNLLHHLLREELGFRGIAVTDWEDIIKLYKFHKVAKNMKEAVKIAIDAGIDMSMTPNDYTFNDALIELVQEGTIKEARLDSSCRRILWVKQQLGMLNHTTRPNYEKFGGPEHRKVALEAALESITLLKNTNSILPLDKKARVLLCGPAANSLNMLNGAWTHTWQGVDTSYNTKGVSTIYEAVKEMGEKNQVHYLTTDAIDPSDTASLFKNLDAIILCLGEKPSTEKPGDIKELELSQEQKDLIQWLHGKKIPIIAVMCFNRPLIVRAVESKSTAMLHAYLPGDMGGKAIAKIIYGEENPSGKLPFTYPKFTGDFVPYDHKYTEQLDPNFGLTAFDPQWEFGTGLSYSKFSYKNMKIENKTLQIGDTLEVSIEVENSSSRKGKEVVMLFVSDMVASVTPSVKRLRNFQKISIPGGSTKQVVFRLPVNDLAFVNRSNKWMVEPGEFEISINTHKEKVSIE